MRSYAVTWRNPHGLPYSGKLQLEGAQLRLEGSSSGRASSECVRYADITSVQLGRRPQERIGGRPVLTLGRRHGVPIRITSLAGAGTLLEVESSLRELGHHGRTARSEELTIAKGHSREASSGV